MPTPPRDSAQEETQHPHYLVIGEILRPHGIAGEVRMRVLTAYPERIAERETLYLDSEAAAVAPKPYVLQSVRMHQSYALLKLQGIDSRDQANDLRQLYVLVAMEDAIPLEEDEFYLHQMIGLDVATADGRDLGRVEEILQTGANDVLLVRAQDGSEVLIPVIPGVLDEVNLERGSITVNPMEGLLP